MPKVSDGYKDARRAQILDAAQRCFLRDGFHGTSMQNLFDEAGLSSGAVYRYFPGKDVLIVSLAEHTMRETLEVVRAAASGDPGRSIGEVIAEVVGAMEARSAKDGYAKLAVLIWAESLRNPKVGGALTALFVELRAELTVIVRDHQRAGTLPGDVPAEALVGVLFSSLTGYVLQLAVSGPPVTSGAGQALQALFPQTLPADVAPAE